MSDIVEKLERAGRQSDNSVHPFFAEAAAEIRRLRAALEEIDGMGFDPPMTFSGTELDWSKRRANLMQGIARKALKGET